MWYAALFEDQDDISREGEQDMFALAERAEVN